MSFKDLENPLLDILIPVYNEEKHLPYMIQSLKQQKFINRIMVLDDYSTDKSNEICLKYGLEVYTVPLRINERETELAENLNFGLEMVKSPYVMKLDGDIQLSRNYITKLIKFFENKAKDNIYCIGGLQLALKPIWYNVRQVLFHRDPVGAARIYRTSILRKIGGFCAEKYYTQRAHPDIEVRGRVGAETDKKARNLNYFTKFFPMLKVLHLEPNPSEFKLIKGVYSKYKMLNVYGMLWTYNTLVTSILILNLKLLKKSIHSFVFYLLKEENKIRSLKTSIILFLKGLIIRLINNEEIRLKLKKRLG